MNKQNKKIAQEKEESKEKSAEEGKGCESAEILGAGSGSCRGSHSAHLGSCDIGGSSSKGTAGTQAASQTTESQASETQSSDSQTKAATLNTETDTVAENGDKVNIDYTGYMDGENSRVEALMDRAQTWCSAQAAI